MIVDPRTLAFGVNPDPIRALVHLGAPENVDTVMVDGRILVEGGRLTMADQDEILAAAAASSREGLGRPCGAMIPASAAWRQAFPPALADWHGA